ncbi:ABC transporter permease [Lachnobacterium bovis]|jgi:ABC-type transport system involved in multi-copper enzyme maturation permease subunit|uniref:ABC-2 family transporter protein n=1 Tax=Lachnobacterium bovis DSM 14045 TaxID=1122142 RepID=A0A1H3IGV5_9FIRM|nr:ABC transporter permease [Lachnobacterium bovis]MBQ1801454.1 ABC transporter permease [Lachnobacterium sp.]SDY27046.1 ABC-2 family transporter protein [Lachnobacterium bovis DSM 14045]
MNGLLKYEFKKTISAKSVYICAAICAIVAIINAVVVRLNGKSLGIKGDGFLIELLPMSLLSTLVAIVIPILVCEEMESGCIKTMIGKGYSRSKIFFAKEIISVICTVFLVAIVLGVGVIVGLIAGIDFSNVTAKLFINIILELLVFIVIANVSILSSILMGKVGKAIALAIFGPSVVDIIVTVIQLAAKNNTIPKYWYSNYGNELMVGILKNSSYARIGIMLVVYILLFSIISFVLLRRKDF